MEDIEKLATIIDNANKATNKRLDAISSEIKNQKPPIVNVSPPEVNVNVPDVIVPPIEVPKMELPPYPPFPEIKVPPIVIPKFPEIKVPKPEVKVEVPRQEFPKIPEFPKVIEVKGIEDIKKELIGIRKKKTDIIEFPDTQEVSGVVAVKNFPLTQDVTGLISIENWPTTYATEATQSDIKDQLDIKLSELAASLEEITVHIGSQVGLENIAEERINPATEDGNLATLKQENNPYTTLVDDVSVANKTFIGKAPAGTSESSAAWRISCLDETGAYPKTQFASGVSTFTKVWDDREDYIYS